MHYYKALMYQILLAVDEIKKKDRLLKDGLFKLILTNRF